MPLNMNTVGTGTGIGRSTSIADASLLFKPSPNIQYNDKYASYYITDYNSMVNISTDDTESLNVVYTKQPTEHFMRIFTLHGKLYGIAYTPYTYYINTDIDVTIYELTIRNTGIISTKVVSYTCPNYTYSNSSTYFRNSEYPGSLFGYYTGCITTDYVYFINWTDEKFTYDGSEYTTKVLCWSRFDGSTITNLQKLYISNTKHPEYLTYNEGYDYMCIDVFTPINRFNTEFIMHTASPYKSSYDPRDFIITIDENGYMQKSECSLPTSVSVNVTYNTTFNASFSTFIIIENEGLAQLRYKPSSVNNSSDRSIGIFRFDINKTVSNNKTTITINNLRMKYGAGFNNYSSSSKESKMIFNCCTPGVICVGGTVYSYDGIVGSTNYTDSKLSVPTMLVYNTETKMVEYYQSDPNIIKTNNADKIIRNAPYSYPKCTNLCYVDPNNNMVIYLPISDIDDSSTKTITPYGSLILQKCSINNITNGSESSSSRINALFHKNDVVYCSKNITSYIDDSGEHKISSVSKRFVIKNNTTTCILCNHETISYRPCWIWVSASNDLMFIDASIIDDTTINGNFIPGMTVSNVPIYTDGHQNVSVQSITSNGVYIDMKGVE